MTSDHEPTALTNGLFIGGPMHGEVNWAFQTLNVVDCRLPDPDAEFDELSPYSTHFPIVISPATRMYKYLRKRIHGRFFQPGAGPYGQDREVRELSVWLYDQVSERDIAYLVGDALVSHAIESRESGTPDRYPLLPMHSISESTYVDHPVTYDSVRAAYERVRISELDYQTRLLVAESDDWSIRRAERMLESTDCTMERGYNRPEPVQDGWTEGMRWTPEELGEDDHRSHP